FGIGVYDHERNRLFFPGVQERDKHLKDIYIDLAEEKTLAAYCINNQKEIILDNYFESYADFIQPNVRPVTGDGNSTSIVYLPLTIGNRKLGVLTVQSFDEGAFNEYHINIIRNIALYTRIALENANVYRELEMNSLSLKRANKSIGEQNKLIEDQYQQLVSINREKNNLINILAHDLRNPLATAMSMTELVRYEKGNLSAEQYQASEIIWRGLNRMNDMITKILDIKAVESQKINLDLEIINANELIVPLEKTFSVEAERKEIKLHFSSESEEPLIKADRNYLIQVMENIISNALKFSPSHRNVYVRVLENEEFVKISVKDEGPGIPENECGDLFKKYQKLSPRPTAGEQSFGLGLSIVKKYVEVMQGNIRCESKVGRGSEFIVEFKKESVVV
ncbi:MAG: GAF domain-containing sensor histidine kinase, partial [Cyclobacteriaceae bacterium]|nr:GAF domain-containing sensor histidine kinase [Cyclobacteriaceae bacterium]